jgi:hypothetical protein
MPLSVAELQPVLYDLFTSTADYLAQQTGFCQRARKLTGSVFAQAVVFSLLENPNATLDDFAQTACDGLDVPVSPQAFDQRFTSRAAEFLHDLFRDAFNASFASLQPAVLPVLRRFNGVFVRDGTLVALPACLADVLPGRSGRHAPDGKAAACKIVWEAEVTSGGFTDVSLLAGLDNEKISEVAGKDLPRGALLLEDMGFFCGARLQAYDEQGVYFVTRIPAWTAVFDSKGKRIDLVKLLRKQRYDSLEMPVRILHGCKQSVRLLAVRLPQAEAEQRRARVRQEAKKRGRPVSQKKLDLCEWNIVVSNAPAELIGLKEAWVIRRVRWQIELVFKVFKSEGKIDQTRSQNPHRVLGELWAKLLGMVVQQWLLLAGGYVMLKHSARRAARRVRKCAARVLAGLGSPGAPGLGTVVAGLARVLHRHCRIQRRKASPSTLDRLLACDQEFDQTPQAA